MTLHQPVDMQTAQDTLISTFLMTDVRHAFAAVRILLELRNFQEIFRKIVFYCGSWT